MKLDKLKLGMTLYSLSRQKMGNTTMSTTVVHDVLVVGVDAERQMVTARWNGNPPKAFPKRVWSKWRLSKPQLVGGALGQQRPATREEINAAKSPAASSLG